LQAVGDNLNVPALTDEIPLARDIHGVYRVGGTRVTLDLVERAFNRGATAEEIVQKYDNLRLPDVYQVIGYYLKHADELAEYFENRARRKGCFRLIRNGRPRGFAIACSPARTPGEMGGRRVLR
jgi:uncharacterized protein (DUF433 family)